MRLPLDERKSFLLEFQFDAAVGVCATVKKARGHYREGGILNDR